MVRALSGILRLTRLSRRHVLVGIKTCGWPSITSNHHQHRPLSHTPPNLQPTHTIMPAIDVGKVLVTGVNGYIGIWVAKMYLDQGLAVRGTVRSESKAAHLRSVFAWAGDKFEIVIVDDITRVCVLLLPSRTLRTNVYYSGRSIRRCGTRCRCHRSHRISLPPACE